METLLIKDFLSNSLAVSAMDGDKVFSRISELFDKEEEVVLDFSGIDLVITAFLNSSIGKLYSIYEDVKIRRLLDIRNLDTEELLLLKLVIERAKERFGDNYLEEE